MAMRDSGTPGSFVLLAALFEGGLAVVALALGWLLNVDPLESFHADMAAVGIGVTATLPLLLGLWLCLKWPIGPLRKILRVIDEVLVPLFRQCNLLELAVISLLAGLGEEMLFRGIVQAAVAGWIDGPRGVWIALAAAAILFGLAHSVTFTYAILATLIGFYLGGLWLATGNLFVPIIVHACYDLVALTYLVKLRTPRYPVYVERG